MTNAPWPRQRLVGFSLRQYRESLGYSLRDAARILECDVSKISRVETGQRGIRPKELRELLTEYGVGAAAQDALAAIARPRRDGGWWSEYGDVLAGGYLDFAAAESAASGIVAYAPVQVPELLQAPGYARAVTAADPGVPQDDEPVIVAATLARQEAVLRECGPGLAVVIGEAALRQRAGGADVMRAQLRHLAGLADGCPQVTIRLLPFTAGAPAAGGAGGFTVLQFGEVPAIGLVHVAGPSGGICPDTPDAAAPYLRAFTRLESLSLSPDASARRIWQLNTRGC
jgi:transcriptional regulator with XRE-family HTH domain